MHPGLEMSKHYFSWLGGPGVVSIKKRDRTHYTKLLFFHLVGSTGHLVHFGASGS
jgi:hypothetical protein